MPASANPQRPTDPSLLMPPEWHAQEAVWMSWPDPHAGLWPGSGGLALDSLAEWIAALSKKVAVAVNVDPQFADDTRQRLHRARADLSAITLYPHPVDDVWCRDHGPLFVHDLSQKKTVITNWKFNAWGNKFPHWQRDNCIPVQIADSLGMPRKDYPFILEGGAIDVDGAGRLLTTKAVLLNPNRNPGITEDEYASAFAEALGVNEVIWLDDGIAEDDTDGHIDNVARFVAPGKVVVLHESNSEDPNHKPLSAAYEKLRQWRSSAGETLEVIQLPAPAPVITERDGTSLRLPASYANFLITNGAVFVPTFGQPSADQCACGILAACFPDRHVIPFDCRVLLLEGGALHCLTQQQPVAP